MRRIAVAGLAGALGLLVATPALAQRTTGGIAGTVRDSTGGALPGATVSVSGPALMGAQSAGANHEGFYRFVGLPPGLYQLRFSLSGFSTVTRNEIRVPVGETIEENVTLNVSQLQEQVTVIGDANVVDTTSNEVGSNYGRDWVENAPLRRNSFLDLVAAAPGSLRGDEDSRRTMVYGASYDENSFQIDGTDVNDNFFNEVQALTNPDSVQEIEVLSLGAPAEYGNVTGAVYNVVTRQGSNEFHGDAGFFWQSDGLTGDNTGGLGNPDGSFVDACATDDTRHCGYLRDHFADLSAQVGGPILKDRLWFFGSYQRQRDKFAPAGIDPAQFVDRTDSFDRYFVKLNWQVSARHRFLGTFHQDESREPLAPGPTDAPSTFVARDRKTPTPGLGYTGVLSFYGDVFLSPADASLPKDQARFNDIDTGEITGGHYYWYELHPTRTTASAKISHLADDFLGGSHDFRFGVQYQDSEAGGIYGYNDLIFTYLQGGALQGYGYTRVPFSYSGNSRGIGVFLDDTFRVNERLSFNLGVRYDHNRAFSREQDELDASGRPTGHTFPETELYTWDYISPRLGFNLKLTPDGKTVLKGHWGRYHRAIITGEFANVIGPSIKPIFFGFLDPVRRTLVDLEQVSDNSNLSVDPNYRSPAVDQLNLSLERELAPSLGLAVNYVHKRGRDFGAWRDVGGVYRSVPYLDNQGTGATGSSITVLQLQNSLSALSYMITNRPEMDHDIDAASLVLVRPMTGKWSMNASLTWLRSKGRTTDSLAGSALEQRGGLQFRNFGRDPNDFVNTGGRLRGDTPWQGKVQLVSKLRWGLTGSMNFSHRSGANLARILSVREQTRLGRSRILGEERGELGRLPSATLLDLRLQKDLRLGGRARLTLLADAFNLLNEDANEATVSDIGTSSSYQLPTNFLLPRRLMVGARFQF